ncbi:hypothetical protein IF1G_04240 [Cordyceps javanica]|uniref:Uncharacterized protein n=1 Tax=Cordyceps javanica TaxID=43265 RepID=A0A545V5L3_9HYPO|nr:hypothetical protein IF1G_04240 [Cordyceps javanica]
MVMVMLVVRLAVDKPRTKKQELERGNLTETALQLSTTSTQSRKTRAAASIFLVQSTEHRLCGLLIPGGTSFSNYLVPPPSAYPSNPQASSHQPSWPCLTTTNNNES